MTEQMRSFLNELADLIDKHEIEMEVNEGFAEFCQMSKWENDELVRDFCEIQIGYIDAYDLRELAKKV